MADSSNGRVRRLLDQAEALFDDRKLALRGVKHFGWGDHFLHFWILVIKSFLRNRCPVRASALAYTTLLALIPMLAVGLGVSSSLLRGEGSDKTIEQFVNKMVDEVTPHLGLPPVSNVEGQTDVRVEIKNRIREFIANIHSGTLGLTGTVALVFVAIGLLATIETTFNDIWGVTRGRPWVARIIQYWAVITLGPLLLILAMGVSIGSQFELTQEFIRSIPMVGSAMNLMPFLILSGTFTSFYLLIPNTRVDWRAAIIGGLVGGVLWQANSQFNVAFASKVVTASKIYGPLGAVPVFLIGMYFSWLILLFGAQVAYAYQNRRIYLQERQAETVNQFGREFVALRVMTEIGRRFDTGSTPPTANVLANELDAPTRLVTQVLYALTLSGLIIEVAGLETGYSPARPLENITCHDVLKALRVGDGQELTTREDARRVPVRSEMDRIRTAEQAASAHRSIRELVDEVKHLPDGEPGGTANATA